VLDLLNQKLRRMYAALAGLSSNDLSVIQPKITEGFGYCYTEVDFNQHSDEIALANSAFLLVTNIASLKDHLKVWCKKQGVAFQGDALINSNRAVALIHDLWNIDKHAELNLPPRSGIKPTLQNIRTALTITSGTSAGSGAFFSMDPRTGKITTGTSGGGSVQLALVAQIADEAGNVIADFTQTCSEAIDAWSATFQAAGIPCQ
jgi:hypothetical protein